MKSRITLLITISLFFLVGELRIIGAPESYLDSSVWPIQVTILQDFEQKDVIGEEYKVRSGSTGILQRIENGLALVDMGRFGVHWVEPNDTNFEKLADRLAKGLDLKEFPNSMAQLGNKIVQYVDRDATHILLEDIRNVEFFICFYVNEINQENALITRYLDRAHKHGRFAEHNILPIAFPGEDHWYGYFKSAFNSLPVFIPHMRLSYAAAMWHLQNETPSFVLIDANGKVLYRSKTLRMNESRMPKRRSGHSRKADYAQIEQELIEAFSTITH